MSRISSLPTLQDLPEFARDEDAGLGAIATEKGTLPLESIEVRARVDGLLSQVEVAQTFVNPTDLPLEATYLFPLPDRAGVHGFRMEVAGRVIVGKIDEREKARARYDRAIEEGKRAAIAEEERSGVFTMRVGNLLPGERAVVRLTYSGVLPYVDGEVTFRFPLVVAPRYVPGLPLPGPSVGDGVSADTDAAPDASRISPPVLLPGFPNPVQLAMSVDLHGVGSDPVAAGVRSTLHAVWAIGEEGVCRVTLQPGNGDRLDRDFVLRFRLGSETIRSSLSMHPDGPDGGAFALTIVPPSTRSTASPAPRDLVFVLDSSGSMEGWKIVAARRAVAGMIETLGPRDRFALLEFNNQVRTPTGLGTGLSPATDRNRFLALEFLNALVARGGTEMAEPLARGSAILSPTGEARDRVLVLVTDGQVANEDQILGAIAPALRGARVFALGIDRAVNEGFLNRLAAIGGEGGGCELVESEEGLVSVSEAMHRRIGTPVLNGLTLAPEGWEIEPDSLAPERCSTVFAGVPLLILGRYRGVPGPLRLTADQGWSERVEASVRENPAVATAWARGQVRKLEDRYLTQPEHQDALERAILATSLRYRVLCRFSAFVAVDEKGVVNPGGGVHQVVQPVSAPAGWLGACYSLGLEHPKLVATSPSPPSAAREVRLRDFTLDADMITKAFSALPDSRAPRRESLDDTAEFEIAPAPKLPPRFQLASRLGTGGSGNVFRAFDPELGQEVALKFWKLGPDQPQFQTVRDWAGRIAALNCPAILGPIEIVVDPSSNDMIIIYSHCEGSPLANRADQTPPREAAELALWLAETMEVVHRAGLAHGNLTPSQILILPDGSRRLTELGELNAWIKPSEDNRRSVRGTPAYMSPEVIRGEARLQPPADVFAMGVMLYQWLTGRLPFDGSSIVASMKAITTATPIPPRQWNRQVPKPLEAICLKALSKDPKARPTAGEMAEELRRFLASTDPKPARKRFWK